MKLKFNLRHILFLMVACAVVIKYVQAIINNNIPFLINLLTILVVLTTFAVFCEFKQKGYL